MTIFVLADQVIILVVAVSSGVLYLFLYEITTTTHLFSTFENNMVLYFEIEIEIFSSISRVSSKSETLSYDFSLSYRLTTFTASCS